MGNKCAVDESAPVVEGSVLVPGTRKYIKILGHDENFPFVPDEHHLESVMEFFDKSSVLGMGASCEVCAVKRKTDGQEFAMKIMKRRDQWNEILFKQEHDLLILLNHRNIVAFGDCYMDKVNFYLCVELCKGGELFDKIKELKKFSEMHAAQMIRTVLYAVDHCHSKNVVHRDLKPENLVFRTEKQRDLVLIDFGDSRIIKDDEYYEDFVGTAFYLAPECVRKRTGIELKKSDVWTIGVITWIMLTGKPPFSGADNKEILRKIIRAELKFPKKVRLSDSAKDFLTKMLAKETENRLSTSQALKHPWLKGRAGTAHLGAELLESLSNYSRSSKLKKVLVRMLGHQLTSFDKKALRLQFDQMDTNGDGMISLQEMADFLHKMGEPKEEAMRTATTIISQIDQDGDKMITRAEWQDARISTKFQDDNLIKEQFKKLDLDGDGFISHSELTNLFKGKLGPKLINKMIEEVDSDNDGKISYEEFVKAMKKGSLHNSMSYHRVGSPKVTKADFPTDLKEEKR